MANDETTDLAQPAPLAMREEKRFVIGTQEARALALERSKAIADELRRVSRKSRRPKSLTNGGGGFRTRRSDRAFHRYVTGLLLVLVAVPSFLSGVYFAFLSADQYVTEAKLSIRSGDSSAGIMPLGLSGLLDSNQSRDGQIVAEYVKSPALAEELDKSIGLRTRFSRAPGDFVAALRPDSSVEELSSYWRRQVRLEVDGSSGLLDLTVRAFTPEDSLAIANAIIERAENMINELTRRKELEEFRRANEEFALARQRLQTAVAAQRDARNKAGLLDVGVAEKSYGDILTALRLDLASVETTLDSYRRQNLNASPEIAPLKAREAALNQQIADYEGKIARAPSQQGEAPTTLVASSANLVEKETDVGIARTEYTIAASAFEQARLNLESKRTYLLLYVKPRLAEISLYPPRLLFWLGITLAAFLIFAVIWGMSVLVRDNKA